MLIPLAAVSLFIGLLPAGALAFVCPQQEGFYANYADCGNTYWVCTNGRLFFMHCPSNLRYDERQAKCLYPYQVPICPNGDSWKPFQPTTTPDSVTGTEDASTEGVTEPIVTPTIPDYNEDEVTSETMFETSTEHLPSSDSTSEEEEDVTASLPSTEHLPSSESTTEEEEDVTTSLPSTEGNATLFKMLKSRENKDEVTFGYNIPKEEMEALPFDPKMPTKFLIHGWNDNMGWMQKFRNNIIQKYDKYQDSMLEADKQTLPNSEITKFPANVIVVDWSGRAQNVTFETAVNKTELVAEEIANLIDHLIKWRGVNPRNVHLIGQQIGAHVAGFVGEKFGGNNKIGQITGLDPISRKANARGLSDLSSPQYFSATNGLDSSDAGLVTVIHTTMSPSNPNEWTGEGHYDFYPNGGYMSERLYRCFPPEVFGQKWDCDYLRAAGFAQYEYSPHVNGYEVCQPVGYRCADYKTFVAGMCSDCGENGTDCQLMPNYFDHWDRKQGSIAGSNKFYFEAGGIRTFCLYHYQVVVHLTNGWPSDYKNISLDFVLEDQILTINLNHLSDTDVETKSVMTSDVPLYPLNSVKVGWKGWFGERKHPITSIDVNYMSNIDPGTREMFSVKLCPKSNSLFKPCKPENNRTGIHWPFGRK